MSDTIGTEVTFFPSVTLTEQPDGSYVATTDWSSSITSACLADGTEIDYEGPVATAASDALDAYLKGDQAGQLHGFVVPKVVTE